MITSNRRLLGRVCEALLTSCGLKGFWTEDGPTIRAMEQRASSADALTASQRVTLELVRMLWLGESELKVSKLLHEMDEQALVKLGTLLVGAAYGERGVSDWLAIERGEDARADELAEDPPMH